MEIRNVLEHTKMLKKERGVAGTNLLLGLIVTLFVIGLIVMIFSLMSGALENATTDADAIQVINDTSNSLVGVVDFFDLFIVIGAMVVLILLTVVIVSAIRGSGFFGGSGSATA